MEYVGVYGMFVLAALLFANGLRLLIFCGYSRSFAQVAAVGAAILLLFGAPLVLACMVPGSKTVALAVSAVGGVISLLFIAFCVATLVLGRRPVTDSWDYVFVLGAGLKKGRVPSLTLSSRLDSALGLLADNPRGVAVVCGGRGSDELVAESAAMREYLLQKGLPEERIIQDPQSSTTYENLFFGMQQIWKTRLAEEGFACFQNSLQCGFSGAFGLSRLRKVKEFNALQNDMPRVVIVTSDFHTLRTMITARFVPGMRVVGVVGKPSKLYYLPLGLARDFVSLVLHIVRIVFGREH